MSGPCSLPRGSRNEYAAMWEMVCDLHKDCTPDFHKTFDKHGDVIEHKFITRREWLFKRNRLNTGKTQASSGR